MQYLHNHDCPFEAYVTNLGKYNEGELVGEWVKFPCDEEELEKVFERIGINSEDEFGNVYEEYFMTDYDIYVDGLKWDMLGEYISVERLNEIAQLFEDVEDYNSELFSAILEYESIVSIEDIEYAIENIDNYTLLSDVNDYYDLGYYWIENSGCYNLSSMGNLSCYFDYEAFGRDISLDEGGMFTDYGYIYNIKAR